MKILIIGSGGREYAIAIKLLENKDNSLFFAPGNGATNNLGTNLDIKDFEKLADFCEQNKIDLTIVGPEDPLTNGIVDVFKKRNLVIFGPSKNAAKLEGSKVYMKNFLKKYNIKTARFLSSNDKDEICKFIDTLGDKVVVKADGLCAGKGVIIANSHDEAKKEALDMLSGKSFGEAGKNVVIEEFLDGYELSFFAICDGKNFVSLPFAQDHKKLNDGDMGPNTGGMGAYAPSPLANDNLLKRVENEIVRVTLDGMIQENAPFCGVLFVGLMIVNNEPYVLEYNVRFGDPECEVLMPLIKGDLAGILKDASLGKLTNIELYNKFSVGVVMASENYPFASSPKQEISVENIPNDTHICYAGVSLEDKKLYANGGRVLVCVGSGDNIKEAQEKAYMLCQNVKFKGAKFRKDIAYQALK
ncbi:phosphoribosylamine--glycine ligase [Campylobacter sputorum subsp. bubulus]|uniref:Phosphoribosylamine--glycine ligase n=1 Tax=Campylobacter sputorum subsp. sputorum TaxID=32024 RepID=A0A381DHT5_9BACT|nr:phosphoribosylamine--glycine ligase [Campylobacter sputorum]ASM35214.1 phosphoribosylamine-glycine ligase [Campylobacter sputorum aubsp. sputorum RM3237]ASM36894.1 phosphoribosylamine-glycine ligase [Campylobacter sputorum bv. faecalis CCUG 20703]KAB0580977.1 phosphoribosylamine--glycine ligase [Campylobacter sputorum subsp. sputorum]QEL05403.1 phosphoribosylamine-glycine ligase [Campylobacter sputorum subsp. sputorum]SUX08785.1 phosphoribosylamine--glycine ligase [Campylobacter sputorum su